MLRAVPQVLEQLDELNCRRLLQAATHGRLAFTEGTLPMVLPVTYVVRGEDVIASVVGVEVDRVLRGAVVAFEVDSYNPQTQEGWCVSVVGLARPITYPKLIAELDALGFAPYTPERIPAVSTSRSRSPCCGVARAQTSTCPCSTMASAMSRTLRFVLLLRAQIMSKAAL